MIHKMRLRAEPFMKIYSGEKTVELRLNDEKRQQVKTGDFIEFSRLDNADEKIVVEVTALHHFRNFQELYKAVPKEKMGYRLDEFPDPNHMDDYYSKDEQAKYGVLGIEFVIH